MPSSILHYDNKQKTSLRKSIRSTLKYRTKKTDFFSIYKQLWSKYRLFYFFKQLYNSYSGLQTKKIISAYYPLSYEINCLLLIKWLKKLNHTIVLPKVLNHTKELIFFEFNKTTVLNKNIIGINEPSCENLPLKPEALLVPLIAFDNEGTRLGQGGGFYDYTINKLNKTKKVIVIGLGYSYQKINKIPKDSWDIKLDAVVTDNYYRYFN